MKNSSLTLSDALLRLSKIMESNVGDAYNFFLALKQEFPFLTPQLLLHEAETCVSLKTVSGASDLAAASGKMVSISDVGFKQDEFFTDVIDRLLEIEKQEKLAAAQSISLPNRLDNSLPGQSGLTANPQGAKTSDSLGAVVVKLSRLLGCSLAETYGLLKSIQAYNKQISWSMVFSAAQSAARSGRCSEADLFQKLNLPWNLENPSILQRHFHPGSPNQQPQDRISFNTIGAKDFPLEWDQKSAVQPGLGNWLDLEDPFDHTPFRPGERICMCQTCEVAYHKDTVLFLKSTSNNKCIVCDHLLSYREVELPARQVRSSPLILAWEEKQKEEVGPSVWLGLEDPFEHTPFHPGELICQCKSCGTGYHKTTAQFLRNRSDGKCIVCRNPLAYQEVEVGLKPDPAKKMNDHWEIGGKNSVAQASTAADQNPAALGEKDKGFRTLFDLFRGLSKKTDR